ncbi:TetR/AcrR family transcriptional regulator C-terminal domain-containing protein [Nocardiopsis sediminis]|uniref:TetR/AcrR family transcriptional regulator C-terminal domain-containing protein n=1 Tax=Nocardiopsis sediminis TaxID=1778267 RepID=A0ABV8FRP5_9ACTN
MSPKRAASGEAVPGGVWLREPGPASRAPALTRERIVAAAVGVLDAGGTEGLSMRRLADALGVHATSLYWHVAHRDDLLDLALDAVFGEVALPAAPAQSWRAEIGAFMGELRAALLRHPWSAALAVSRPLLGPNALAHSESVYAALARAGLAGLDLRAAAAAVSTYVIGSAAAEAAWRNQGAAAARSAVNDHLRRNADRYPTLAAHAVTGEEDWEAHFARGADAFLAGLATPRPAGPATR